MTYHIHCIVVTFSVGSSFAQEMNHNKLHQSEAHEPQTDPHPDVDRCCVGNHWFGAINCGAKYHHEEGGGQSKIHPGRWCLPVDPECDPGKEDDQDGWQVDLMDEVSDVTLES